MSIFHKLGDVAHAYVAAKRAQLQGELAMLDKADEAIDQAADSPDELFSFFGLGGGIPDLGELLKAVGQTAEPSDNQAAEPAPSQAPSNVTVDPPAADPNFDPQPAALAPEHIELVHRELSRQGDRARQSIDGLVNQLPELGAELVSAAVEHLVGAGLVERVGDGVIRLISHFTTGQ